MSFDELCALLPIMASDVQTAQGALGSDLQDISPTVLVLEDEDSLRDMICYGFDMLNCQPVQSESIGDATTLIRSLTKLDIAVLDIGLPDGLGPDLIQLIRNTHPNTSIVMLTAFKDLELIMECFNKGAIDYLIKPFDMGKFNTTFGHILYRQRVKQFALMMKIGKLPNEIPKAILNEYSQAVAGVGAPDGTHVVNPVHPNEANRL
ncbi:response regulator [bacterium]|nr:response regulator [bacterium]